METYFIDGFRIAARSLTQARMAADLLKKSWRYSPVTDWGNKGTRACPCAECQSAPAEPSRLTRCLDRLFHTKESQS